MALKVPKGGVCRLHMDATMKPLYPDRMYEVLSPSVMRGRRVRHERTAVLMFHVRIHGIDGGAYAAAGAPVPLLAREEAGGSFHILSGSPEMLHSGYADGIQHYLYRHVYSGDDIAVLRVPFAVGWEGAAYGTSLVPRTEMELECDLTPSGWKDVLRLPILTPDLHSGPLSDYGFFSESYVDLHVERRPMKEGVSPGLDGLLMEGLVGRAEKVPAHLTERLKAYLSGSSSSGMDMVSEVGITASVTKSMTDGACKG